MISSTYAGVVSILVSLACWVLHRWRLKAVFMAGTRLLASRLGTMQLERDEARAEKERYYLKIAEFEKQRNDWHKLYVEQSIGHGNAQNLMMDTIEQMGRVLSAKGIRFQIPRVLHEVRAEFLESHEMPARADEMAPKKPEPSLAS